MRRFLYILRVFLYTGAVFMAGMLVEQGRLYGLYVLVYTGAVFMAGLWIGQWWERSWATRRNTQEVSSSETAMDSDTEADIRKLLD